MIFIKDLNINPFYEKLYITNFRTFVFHYWNYDKFNFRFNNFRADITNNRFFTLSYLSHHYVEKYAQKKETYLKEKAKYLIEIKPKYMAHYN